jgi:hypothetical protein
VDVGRQGLDFIFLRREARELRTRLRSLITLVREPQILKENLSRTFQAFCNSMRASYGLILVFESEAASLLVSYRWNKEMVQLPSSDLMFDDVAQPKLGGLEAPLNDAVLVTPLYAGTSQIGLLVLGPPENALRYSQNDVETLLEFSDRVSGVMHVIQHETEYFSRLSDLARVQQPILDTGLELIPTKMVEDGLRNMHDYSYLGNSPLASLEQVRNQLSSGIVTHLDRGKEVHQILLNALEKLRPSGDTPREPIPRDWYPYIVLYDAYVKEVQNRDIMSRLYISEGTFNRIRRATIRSVAKVLAEMEKNS